MCSTDKGEKGYLSCRSVPVFPCLDDSRETSQYPCDKIKHGDVQGNSEVHLLHVDKTFPFCNHGIGFEPSERTLRIEENSW